MTESPATALPSLNEVKGWIGQGVDELGGGTVGQAHGLFVDAESGEPSSSAANASTIARPSPRPEPVTIATSPFKFIFDMLHLTSDF